MDSAQKIPKAWGDIAEKDGVIFPHTLDFQPGWTVGTDIGRLSASIQPSSTLSDIIRAFPPNGSGRHFPGGNFRIWSGWRDSNSRFHPVPVQAVDSQGITPE